MVSYNPKDWWKLIFYFHKADTFRKLMPAMIAVMTYTAIFYYVETKVLHIQAIKNPIAVHSLVGLYCLYYWFSEQIPPMTNGGKAANFGVVLQIILEIWL
jgi:hypothetical protein